LPAGLGELVQGLAAHPSRHHRSRIVERLDETDDHSRLKAADQRGGLLDPAEAFLHLAGPLQHDPG
jgi:hypothetical protein